MIARTLAAGAGLIAFVLIAGGRDALAGETGGDDSQLGLEIQNRYGLSLLKADKDKPRLSLTPYGQVNQTLMFTDDGLESDSFIVDNNMSSSRLGIIARLLTTTPWPLGFQYEAGLDSPGTTTVRATDSGRTRPFIAGDNDPFTRLLHGWVDGPYGRLTGGKSYPVIANWIPNPGRTFATDQVSYFLIGGAFNPVISNPVDSRLRLVRPWTAYAAPMQWPLTLPLLLVRYDSPAFAGVTISAAVAENDVFDVGLRYKVGFDRVALDTSVAFHKNENPDFDGGSPGFPDFEESIVGGIGLRDVPTGVFGVLGANYRMFDGSDPNDFDTQGNRRPDDFSLWGELGLRRNLFGIGDTVIYGVAGYGHDRGEGRNVPGTAGSRWLKTRVLMAGVNLIQELDFAKKLHTRLDLYAGYRQWRGDFVRTTSSSDPAPFTEDVDTLHIVTTGLRLRF
ncbi:MAG: hypothetical protein MJE12_23450 [Alphaproteobacteria bacterium]|nr:hypothetical protein [Alphaproteobacteria bacterium]